MMKMYEEVRNARLVVTSIDAQYMVHFNKEFNYGKSWEFDCMSDTVGQYERHATGKMLVSFEVNEETMTFPEDANRRLDYIMPIDDAREFYKFIRNDEPNFWFALDIAFEGELKGYDSELQKCMRNCAGCATEIEPV